MDIATQTSHHKIHKLPITRLRKLPIWDKQTSHFGYTNRTSSLFSFSLFSLSEEVFKGESAALSRSFLPPL